MPTRRKVCIAIAVVFTIWDGFSGHGIAAMIGYATTLILVGMPNDR